MSPEEIIGNLARKQKTVLHLGGNKELESFMDAIEYKNIKIDEISDLDIINGKKYDYLVMGEILELIENPQNLINEIKNVATSTIIYEYKYDEMEKSDLKEHWKKPWQKIGLEYILSREFDYLNSVFLGYATVHTCEMPYNPTEDELKEMPNAIR